MRKSSTEGGENTTAAAWDAQTFEKVKPTQDGKWKNQKEKKAATRVQDISMSLVSGHEQNDSKLQESWPFDSSPCRMFGGKNTKGDGAPVNKELFKTKFGDKIKDDEVNPETDESEIENDSTSSSDDENDNDDSSSSSSDSSDDDDDAHSFGEESEEIELDIQEEVTEKKKATKPDPPEKSILRRDTTRSAGSHETEESRRSNSSKNSAPQNSTERPLVRRSLRRSDSDKRLHRSGTNGPRKASRDGGLGVSCHPNIETKNNRRAIAKKPSAAGALGATTTHDGGPTRRSRNLARVRSSDGLDGMRPPPRRGGGLGPTVSFHGDVEQRPSRRSSEQRKSSKTDRRGRLTRAMSTHNVKPPEHFSTSRKSSHGEKKERTIAPVVTPQESLSSRKSTHRIKPERGVSRTSSAHSHRSRDEVSELEASPDDHGSKMKTLKRASKRGTSATSQEPKAVPEAAPPEARRDLMVLFREQKTVKPSDLMDQENRRLLHFLAYEHKMGISIKELRRSVSADA